MFRFAFFLTVVFAGSFCMMPFGFQTAKVLDEEEYMLVWQGDVNAVSRLGPTSDLLGFSANPFLGFAYRWGVHVRNLDWGLQLSPQSPLGVDVKYQFIGSQKSTFAAAGGLGMGFISRNWSWVSSNFSLSNRFLYSQNFLSVGVPLFLTLDFHDKSAVTLVANYRYALHTEHSFFNLSARFRTKNTEELRRYFTVDMYLGRSFAGTEGFDHLSFIGLVLGVQGINRRISPEEKVKRRRKKGNA